MPDRLQRLLKSMRRSLRRHGAIDPARLRHVVDERGDHYIAIVLTGDEVDGQQSWNRPRRGRGMRVAYSSTRENTSQRT